jgi:hypothetical protein
MTRSRTAAVGISVLRVAYAAFLAGAPKRATQPWLGSVGAQPGTKVAIRGLSAREVGASVGGLLAAAGGAPVRPWLIVQAAGDLSDIVATAIASRSGTLPDGALAATAVVGGASALLTAGVALAVDA